MTPFAAFCGKELMEVRRTYRLYILMAVFALLGLMSPIVAKVIPDLIGGMGIEGVVITFPESTAMDSWTQFFGNVSQIGILALVIVYGGIMSGELSKGTLVNVLSKGIGRGEVVMSKFAVASAVWTACYLLSFAAAYAYTEFLWDSNETADAALAFACPWAYGLFMLSILILGGIAFKTTYGSLLTVLGATVLMGLASLIPGSKWVNPLTVSGESYALLNGARPPMEFALPLAVCVSLTAACLAASVLAFRRKGA